MPNIIAHKMLRYEDKLIICSYTVCVLIYDENILNSIFF